MRKSIFYPISHINSNHHNQEHKELNLEDYISKVKMQSLIVRIIIKSDLNDY